MPSIAAVAHGWLRTPVGSLRLRWKNGVLLAAEFKPPDWPGAIVSGAIREAPHWLAEPFLNYFADPRQPIDIPLAPLGTAFQRRVWQELRAIPCGTTRAYGALARDLGSGARALAGACRANPWVLVVPCHRVVAASGLGGFAGATAGHFLELKRRLLRYEGAIPNQP